MSDNNHDMDIYPNQSLKPEEDESFQEYSHRVSDVVNHPSHYTSGNIECIDAITEATKGLEGIEAVCTGNVLKYVWRWKRKNGAEDLRKAKWYLEKLIASIPEQV